MIKGVIFDYNGTLYPDDDLHDIAWKDTIHQYFPEIKDAEAALKKAILFNNTKVINNLVKIAGRDDISEEERKKISYEKEARYRELCVEDNRSKLMPGAEELLKYLKDRGYKINLCTASIKPNVDFFIEFEHIDKWFEPDLIVYDNELGTSKLEMYIQALANINLLPEECLVFEDSKNSIDSAIKAGVKKIVKLNHFGKASYDIPEVIQEIKDFYELDYSIFQK